jgi:WD40 repeat protein
MKRQNNINVFISYAHKDGADVAQRLQRDLASQGFDAWLDQRRLHSGGVWTIEIEQAIDKSEVLLALMSPGSYISEICRAEQLRALRKGKRVIPLLARSGGDIPLYLEVKQYRDFTGANPYPSQLNLLLEDIRGTASVALRDEYRTTRVTYVTRPPTVVNFIKRQEVLTTLRDALFADHSRQPLALTALAGMGGIGKTVLAHALTSDPAVQDAFPDGIVWITIGREQTFDLPASFREIGKALGDDLQRYDTLPACINQYKTALAQKAVLIVVDDVWKKSDLQPFLADSRRSRLLFTTRDASIVRFIGAQEHTAKLLDMDQARELLATWAGLDAKPRPPQLDALVQECGNLPLAVSLMGAMLRGATLEEWEDALALLREADLTAIADRLPPGQESFFRAVEVSFAALEPEMQGRYKALAVLLEDMATPLPILQTLWGVCEPEARRISRTFVDRSLAQRQQETGAIRLHDLQLDYVRAQYPDREALELIHGAVRLSSHVIDRDPTQFASQIVGRLLFYQDVPAVQQFSESVIEGAPRPWLRPLQFALIPPGTGLIRTLAGHATVLTGVSISRDGRRAASASWDSTLKVWDLQSGRELHTLEGHSGLLSVNGVAMSADGRRVVSASRDRTLKVWDLESGRELHTLEGHVDSVNGVALSHDGKRAVSASDDRTLKVWDLERGRELRTLAGHTDAVRHVALSEDGRRAVSASDDGTLKVWDLEGGHELHTLKGHSGAVSAVAVSGDGRRAVSASHDRTLKVWDLEIGREIRTLTGHSDPVWSVAITTGGEYAVSGSEDSTVRIWNLQTGRQVRTLTGHSLVVTGVAVSGDGQRAVSGSWDQTIKVWGLKGGRDAQNLQGHSGSVNGVAVSADVRRAVSVSYDRTVKVWDLETRQDRYSLEGHSDVVWSVALSRDGRRAVSASDDRTLKVWDLERGRELHTLEGHAGGVYGVAMSREGRRAVSASHDRTLKVWDLETGREVRTLAGHSGGVSAVAVSVDGQRAVSASDDKTLKVWDLETGRQVRTLAGHSSRVAGVAISGDGRRAISASDDKTLKVWDLETGREVRTLAGHSSKVMGVAVTEDGRRAVFASGDPTLKVWNLETGEVSATFTCDAHAFCCAFAGDREIVAGDASGRVHFLSLELDEDR